MISLYIEALAIFLVAVVAQVIVWRSLKRPDDTVPHQIVLLFTLFWLGPAVYLHFFHRSVDLLIISLSLGSCYIMSFPAASAKSPTVMIYYLLHRHRGLTPQELERHLAQELDLKGDRVKDLQADGLYAANGRPSLAGRALGRVFLSYRKLLGLPVGEG